MTIDTKDMLNSILSSISRIDYVRPDDIPNIDLYMDQVTTFMEKELASSKRHEDDKILTKTMINNYAKNNLLPPPVKKKYSKEHLLVMIFIYYFKNFLPISDIQTILGPLTDKYFHKDTELNLESIYTTLFSKEDIFVHEILEDVMAQFHMSEDLFPDAPKEDQESLREFTFICMLCLDIYIKKQVIEAILDKRPKTK